MPNPFKNQNTLAENFIAGLTKKKKPFKPAIPQESPKKTIDVQKVKAAEKADTRAAGDAFIQAREHKAGILIEQGFSPSEAKRRAAEQLSQEGQAKAREEINARTEQAILEKAQQGLTQDPTQQISALGTFGGQTISPQENILSKIANFPLKKSISLFGTQNTIGKIGQTALEIQQQVFSQNPLNTAANILDIAFTPLSTALTGNKKPTDLRTAQEALNNAIVAIKSDVKDVKDGIKDPIEAQGNFILAQNALNRVAASQHGFGKLNQFYWQGGGQQIEEEIAITQQLMTDLKADLDNAALQAKIRELQNG